MNKNTIIGIIIVLICIIIGVSLYFTLSNNSSQNNNTTINNDENASETTNNQNEDNTGNINADSNVLVVYYSAQNHTEAVAEQIATNLDADTFEIIPADPYTEEESGIDIARAIKYVRYHANDYNISPDNIGVVGFSAGGIANGHAVLEFNDTSDGTLIDNNYKPDEIDKVSATPNAVVMGYSFYGRLSVADLDENAFKNFNLPPTYYVYGTEDPFYNQFNEQVALLQRLNKNIEVQVLNNYPHGFGADGDWISNISTWLDNIFN